MKTIATMILAAGLLAGAAGAQAAGREDAAFQMKTEGVNFADPASVAKFRRELNRQIAAVCNPGDRIGADMAPDFECRRQMAASVEPKILQLVAQATGRTFASTN